MSESFQAFPANRRLLVIDDHPAIHDDFRKILGSTSNEHALNALESALFDDVPELNSLPPYEIDSARQGEEGLEKVVRARAEMRPYALAFVDIRMPPGWGGVETIERIWRADPAVQIVICTAYSDFSWEEIDRRLLRSDQYLILKKPFDVIEVRQLARSLTEKWMLTQAVETHLKQLKGVIRERTRELEESLALSRATLESTADGILAVGKDRRIQGYNRKFLEMLFIGDIDLRGHPEMNGLKLAAEQVKGPEIFLRVAMAQSENPALIARDVIEFLDGRVYERFTQPQRLGNEIVGRVISFHDITEQRAIEHQLRQSQKMEAVGKLAGGVAHDFNNLLTVINGHSQMLLQVPMPEEARRSSLQEILKAGERAAELTRQLLAYSRKSVLRPKILNLNTLILENEKMLRRLIGEDIVYHFAKVLDLWDVCVDPNQIVQVLLTMAVNAREAMPKGGTLTLAVKNVPIDSGGPFETLDMEPGDCVRLTIADTGCGMSEETLGRIFEPFYTSKEQGKGTGLGLAMVHGIVKQSRGAIEVASKPGAGTSFAIYIPRAVREEVKADAPLAQSPGVPLRKATILIVEDEDGVRLLAGQILRSSGYHAVEACDPNEGLRRFAEAESIDLVISDVVMPQMSGPHFVDRILERAPRMPILYISGYPDEKIDHYVPAGAGAPLLPKPFSPNELLQAVASLLEKADGA